MQEDLTAWGAIVQQVFQEKVTGVTMVKMKPHQPLAFPATREFERFDNAVRKVLTVREEDTL